MHRQFLSASHPQDKYKVCHKVLVLDLSTDMCPKFFLRGTQLSQLSDEYDTCLENITQTSKVLSQKRQALPDLRTAFKDATMRFEEASKAREQRHKADELKKELAWAYVAQKQDELTKKISDVVKMQNNRLPKLEKEFKTSQVCRCLSAIRYRFKLTGPQNRNNFNCRLMKSADTSLSISRWAILII